MDRILVDQLMQHCSLPHSTTFGVGDGSSTFALPDLRGQLLEVGLILAALMQVESLVRHKQIKNKNYTHTTDSTSLTGGIRKISEGFGAGGSATGVFTKTADGNNTITGSSSTSPVGGVDFDGTTLIQYQVVVVELRHDPQTLL